MAISQHKSKLSPSGSRYKDYRKKKQFELGSTPTMSKVGETRSKKSRMIGGKVKNRLLMVNTANLYDPATKRSAKVKILDVDSNTANRYFARRDIITKGCIIVTDKGKARVTSRPGQEGTVNAVLVKG
jgi:small subunit ribosomal protein S8e